MDHRRKKILHLMQAGDAWNQIDSKSYNGQPIVASSTDNGKPASRLYCGRVYEPMDLAECWYLANWEHWTIELGYRSPLDDDLASREVQQIAARIDQLLMSAPDEPCYRILCTTKENGTIP